MADNDETLDTTETTQETTTSNYDVAVEELRCYHGVMGRVDSVRLMHNQEVGCYLIRAFRCNSKMTIFLTVKVVFGDSDNSVHHYIIDGPAKAYVLKQELSANGKAKMEVSRPFRSVRNLIKYFHRHRLACKIRLHEQLKRPIWLIRRNQVKFRKRDKLGEGNFCTVFKGRFHKLREDRGVEVAIKRSKQMKRTSKVLMSTKMELFAEAKTMMTYRNLNVVRLYGLVCEKPPFMVCMEFCIGGSLQNALKKFGTEMEEFERQIILVDAARGMRYLHMKKCIHRDLAARNCLISSDGQVKIADFGLSKILKGEQKKFKESLEEAPLAWMAPECIQRESEFSLKTDAWAFGVLMYEVYNNSAKPFAGEEDTAVIRKIRKAEMPKITNRTKEKKMQEVLDAIWVQRPDARPGFQKILELLVDSIIPIKQEDLERMQINKIPGVMRGRLPDLNYEMELVRSDEKEESEESSGLDSDDRKNSIEVSKSDQ